MDSLKHATSQADPSVVNSALATISPAPTPQVISMSPTGANTTSATFSVAERTGPGGGVVSEGEDIRLIAMPLNDALLRTREGSIDDAKMLIALQWLDSSRRS